MSILLEILQPDMITPEERKEIIKHIKQGASDLTLKWTDSESLVKKSYEDASVDIPKINQKNSWKEYKNMIELSVEELKKNRPNDIDWRLTIPN